MTKYEVLIPSSSGLHFKLSTSDGFAFGHGLNPFFVRSSFQTMPCAVLGTEQSAS